MANLRAHHLFPHDLTLAVCIMLAVTVAMPAMTQGFVRVQGDQLTLSGQVIKIKGSNYYPRDHMWASMWSSWDWNEIQYEAGLMQNLGLNSVRILVPYSNGGWNGPSVPAARLQQLEDIVNLLGSKGIRSCATLFDWETSFAARGTATEANHLTYLNKIVTRLKNNPYVFMWDVKNEPDHPANIGGYDDWDYNVPARTRIVDWLSRMCSAVRTADPNHPVSVGIRWYNNVADVLDFVDLACFHSYWWTITNSLEIPTIKTAMGSNQKPIIAEEFGWPSNPTPCNRDGALIYDYNETEQRTFYVQELAAFRNHGIAGCIQWMTFDAKNYTTNQSESFENYFGLWKYDYTLKPAALHYRDNYPAAPFPVEPDTAPPGPVTGFTATAADSQVSLRWTTPSNADFVGVAIRCSTAAFPAGPADGLPVCDRPSAAATQDTFVHYNRTNGLIYYYSAFAYDTSGNHSTPATVSARPVAPGAGDLIGQVKTLPDGTSVTLNRKIVTAVFTSTDSCIYIQEPNRSAGIRVATTVPGLSAGDLINVAGTMTTRIVSGQRSERAVQAVTVARPETGHPVAAVGVSSLTVGGAASPPYLPGVKDGIGLNNMGLLVRLSGRVTAVVLSNLYVDDGAHVEDASGRTGVLVKCPSAPGGVGVGDLVSVTGVIEGSVPLGWTENRRSIRVRDMSDVVSLQ